MAGNIDFFSLDYNRENAIDAKPLHAVEESNLLKWLQDEVKSREDFHDPFFRLCYKNLIAYKNNYSSSPSRQTDANEIQFKRTNKYNLNILFEKTEGVVSRMTRVKPAVEVVPTNAEFEDKISAKAVKLLINHLWYINDIDFMLQKLHRHRVMFGEAWLRTFWNKEKGDLAKNKKERIGDVDYKIVFPWNILTEVGNDYEDSRTLIEKELIHLDDVKQLYPEAKLKLDKKYKEFNMLSQKQDSVGNKLCVYTLYHKADNNFINGRKIVFVHDQILSDEELGFSHGKFPIIRMTDIDVPNHIRAMSRYQQVMNIQNAHNNLSQTILRNEFMVGSPKWMMPKGATNVNNLANGITIVQYQGGVPPQLVQTNPTSNTTFAFRDMLKTEIGEQMGVHPVSSGQPPQGITAAVALQFLNEQENERNMSDIAKHNNFIVDMAKQTIAVAGDYYKPDDGRVLRILGKENKHMIKFFDQAALHKDYDVHIQNSSALPQSLSAKMERVLQTIQYFPNLLPPEKWVELLEFGSVDKMHTLITEAILAAESEEEDIMEGLPVEEPKEWEDHIIHLESHYKKVQSRSFKEDAPPEAQAMLIVHIKTTEMLAFQKAKENPLFLMKLQQMPLFPMFWKHDILPPPMPQEPVK